MPEPLPRLRSCTRDLLLRVTVMHYGKDEDDKYVLTFADGAHFHGVWVMYRTPDGSEDDARELWREFYDFQLEEARLYAWQLAAKYKLKVEEFLDA